MYNWPTSSCPNESSSSKPDSHGSIEIIETIRWSFEDLPDLADAISEDLSQFTVYGDVKSYEDMRHLCHKYNTALQLILDRNVSLCTKRERSLLRDETLKFNDSMMMNNMTGSTTKTGQSVSGSPETHPHGEYSHLVSHL